MVDLRISLATMGASTARIPLPPTAAVMVTRVPGPSSAKAKSIVVCTPNTVPVTMCRVGGSCDATSKTRSKSRLPADDAEPAASPRRLVRRQGPRRSAHDHSIRRPYLGQRRNRTSRVSATRRRYVRKSQPPNTSRPAADDRCAAYSAVAHGIAAANPDYASLPRRRPNRLHPDGIASSPMTRLYRAVALTPSATTRRPNASADWIIVRALSDPRIMAWITPPATPATAHIGHHRVPEQHRHPLPAVQGRRRLRSAIGGRLTPGTSISLRCTQFDFDSQTPMESNVDVHIVELSGTAFLSQKGSWMRSAWFSA